MGLEYCFQNKVRVLLWPVGLTHQISCQIFNLSHSCYTGPPVLPCLHHMCLWIRISASAIPQKHFPSRSLYDPIPHLIQGSVYISPRESSSLTSLSKAMPPVQVLCSFSCLFLHNFCYLLISYEFVHFVSSDRMAAPEEHGFLFGWFIAVYSAPLKMSGPLCLKVGELSCEI